jgi:hypothetical protein
MDTRGRQDSEILFALMLSFFLRKPEPRALPSTMSDVAPIPFAPTAKTSVEYSGGRGNEATTMPLPLSFINHIGFAVKNPSKVAEEHFFSSSNFGLVPQQCLTLRVDE